MVLLVKMNWELSHRADPRALPIADRHYNRQKPGTPQFVPPGRCLVLINRSVNAIWVTSWPYAEFVKHAWAGAWICSSFRNEGGDLSSDLITQAVAATRWTYSATPELGMVTFVNPRKVKGFVVRTADGPEIRWGYSYWKAGFKFCGWTKGGLYALQLLPEDMPDPHVPYTDQLSLLTPSFSRRPHNLRQASAARTH